MKKLIAIVLLSSVILGGTGTALAASYVNSGTTAQSDVSLTLQLDQSLIENPNPGPSPVPDVDPINPPIINPDVGTFGIRYVSDMDFGIQNVSTKNEEYTSTFDKAFLKSSQYNHLTVQNFQADNNGWSITVEQQGAFIPGSTLKFAPILAPDSTITFVLPSTINVTESNGAQEFLTAADGLGLTTAVLNASGGVKLAVPANTAVGNYTTALVWNIVVAP